MATCRNCHGEKRVWVEEEGHPQGGVYDACYHCGNTGVVDEETDFHDRLLSVAATLAYQQESDYRKACNEDPDGDGYDLHAAENMMHTSDYFRARVYERTYHIAEELAGRSRDEQELLVAWNELPPMPLPPKVKVVTRPVQPMVVVSEDDIPF